MQSLATCAWPVRAIRSFGFALLAAAAGPAAHAFDWQVEITPAGELFPALELSQAPRRTPVPGGGNGLVSVRISGSDLPPTLHLEVETPGLRRPARVSAARSAASRAVLELQPRLEWDVAALRGLHAVRRQSMRFTLDGQTRSIEVRLHPLDDALYFVREGRDRVDLGWAFAGYVDPHDPVVDEVLALARAIDPRFDADGKPRDAGADVARVAAVWAALERRGLRYARGDPALGRGPAAYSQRVRLLGEIWDGRRANCIDSSVLIASVLERLGLRTYIVLVPGHAFVGFEAGHGPGATEYLETTLLGTPASAGAPARARFDAARRAGRARWRRVAAKLDGHHGPDYALIDIGTARAYGIIPLAVDGGGTAAVAGPDGRARPATHHAGPQNGPP